MNGIHTRRAWSLRHAMLVLVVACAAIAPLWQVASVRGDMAPSQSTISHVLQFSSSNAWSHLGTLMSYNPRYPGTLGINQSAAYITAILAAAGGTVVQQNFTVVGVPCKNIVGKWAVPGNTSADIVILASHYDARANATRDSDSSKQDDPVPAANDGGSSTAILLDMARVLDASYANATLGISRETWLVFFDAEDQGYDNYGQGMSGFDWIMGSRYMRNNLASIGGNSSRIKFFCLLDMVGGTTFQANQEGNSNQELLAAFFSMGQCLGYSTYFPTIPKFYIVEDDHIPFKELGIPCIDIIDMNYPQWHTTSDDLAHVSSSVIGSVGKVAEGFLLTKIAPSTAFVIIDPDTGSTWTPNSCTGASWWFIFVAFLADYWFLLAFTGIVVIMVTYYVHQQKNAKKTSS